ncbi:MAG: hypothetical protein E5V60_32215, partial [Mesorhizobium sp.]
RLTPLEHPSSVSALRADPPSPTRGEGGALPIHHHMRREFADRIDHVVAAHVERGDLHVHDGLAER